jgi:transposase
VSHMVVTVRGSLFGSDGDFSVLHTLMARLRALDGQCAWISEVQADDLPELHSFAAGLKRDHAAVLNGLTLPHSSGAVEGSVNKVKVRKCQMYGRAKLDLLRKIVILGG